MKIKFLNLTNLLILFSTLVLWFLTTSFIQPFLYYYFQQIGFSTSSAYLRSFLNYPGGVADYMAQIMNQFFKFNTLGSFLIVAVAAIQGLIAVHLVTRLAGKTRLAFSIFTVILILGTMVLCDYRYPYYVSIRLLFVFLSVWAFFFINQKFQKQSLFVWPVLACLLFYIASGAALITFAVSSVLILAQTREKKTWITVSPFLLLFAAALPYLAYKVAFPSVLMNLYRISEDRPPEMLAYTTFYQLLIYYSLLPVALLSVFLLRKIPARQLAEKKIKGKESIKEAFYQKEWFILLSQFLLCSALGYFLFVTSYDPFKKKLLYIEYYAENEKWDEVMKVAEQIQVYDFRVNYQVNRAYSHMGKLPDMLFNYPQLLGSNGLFFDTSSLNGSFTMPISDLYFDLGLMSESQHWAFEAQTLIPYSPRILKRLTMINLVNRKFDLAEKFLNVLDENPLYKDWVNKYKRYVSDTTLAANDPVIAEKRKFNPRKNAVNLTPLHNLLLLLETNKNNRMAYDYLLSLLILDSHLNEFARYVEDYPNYQIKTLPRSWEEALSLYILKTKAIPPFVTPETISKDCMNRLSAFNNVMKQFGNRKDDAKSALKKDFENTYWYYVLYLSPKVTNILKNKTEIK